MLGLLKYGYPGWVLRNAKIDLDFAHSRYYGGVLATFLNTSGLSDAYVANADGTLTWVIGKRTNLALQSVWPAGSAGVAPTSWQAFGTAFAPVASVYGAPGFAYQFTSAASRQFLSPSIAIAVSANTTYVMSALVEANPGLITIQELIQFSSPPAGATVSFPQGATTVPVAGTRITSVLVVAGTSGTASPRFGVGVSSNQTGVATLSEPQMEAVQAGNPVVGPYIPTTTVAVSVEGQPRIGKGTGLLVEEARTNSIRNSTGAGAVVGSPGTLPTNWAVSVAAGLVWNVAGTGTENGAAYVDMRLSGNGAGTSTVKFDAVNAIAASPTQSWSASAYQRISAGSLANISSLTLVGGISTDGVGIQNIFGSTIFSPGASMTRVSASGATPASTTNVIEYFQIATSAGAVDLTLRIYGPQLELGAFPTSYIPTAAAAVTRLPDVVTAAGALTALLTGSQLSVLASLPIRATAVSGAPRIIGETSAHKTPLYLATNTSGGMYDGSASLTAALPSGTFTTVATKIASGFNGSGRSIVLNNGTVATDASALSALQAPIYIGADVGGVQYLNSYIQRLTVWNTRLPDAQLKALTV